MPSENVCIDRKLFPLLTTILEVSNRLPNALIFVYIGDISLFFTIQFVYCLMIHTRECWIKHGLFLCAGLFLLATRITFLIKSRAFSNVRRRVTSELVWDLDMEDPAKYRTIIKKRKVFIYYIVIQSLLLFAAFIVTLQELILRVDKLSMSADYIKQRYPFIFTLITWFCIVDNLVSVYAITVFPIYLYYCCELVEMQIIILRWHIQEFRDQLKSHGARSSLVKMGLDRIVKQHHNLLRCNSILGEHMGTAQIIVYFAVFPCTIFITLLLCSMESIGFQLYDLEWYNWNESNLKTFLILMSNSSKQLDWSSITQTKSYNYETLKEVLKMFYTIYSFLRSYKY